MQAAPAEGFETRRGKQPSLRQKLGTADVAALVTFMANSAGASQHRAAYYIYRLRASYTGDLIGFEVNPGTVDPVALDSIFDAVNGFVGSLLGDAYIPMVASDTTLSYDQRGRWEIPPHECGPISLFMPGKDGEPACLHTWKLMFAFSRTVDEEVDSYTTYLTFYLSRA